MRDDTLFRILPLARKGYCCSQIILMLALETQGRENPELVRAAAGLCHGIGGAGHTCGALTGGVCLISLYGGKGADRETPDERLPLMLESLAQWFADTALKDYTGSACPDIIGDAADASPPQPDPDICGRLIADTVDQCFAILQDFGYDPTEAPDAGV